MGTMQYSEVIYYVGDKVSVLAGYESMISTALLFGAKGAVMATANLFPQIYKKIINAAKNKDLDLVNKIHYELIRPLNEVIFAYPHPGPLRRRAHDPPVPAVSGTDPGPGRGVAPTAPAHVFCGRDQGRLGRWGNSDRRQAGCGKIPAPAVDHARQPLLDAWEACR